MSVYGAISVCPVSGDVAHRLVGPAPELRFCARSALIRKSHGTLFTPA